ncbi:hypothetical protein DMUE_0436 [Dictyocoela muelleri]|nr:hypothetical protein DMUE_0436 [Dictyocoela muelleri]
MLNFKSKSHRGRSALNKSDALCIVEVADKIIRIDGTIIPDKSRNTILPIIMRQEAPNSVIWTNDHASLSNLNTYDYQQDTVSHKYIFINHVTGDNTQTVESFHNELNLEIKKRKGVKGPYRKTFLK